MAEALGALRIDSLAGKLPDELSGLHASALRWREALVIRPELLILDEPLGRLEPGSATSSATRSAGSTPRPRSPP